MKKTFKLATFVGVMAAPAVAMAGTTATQAAFDTASSNVQSLFNGSAAILLALIALIAGVLLAIGGRMTSAYAAFALALIIGIGDQIATGLAQM